MAGSTRFEGYVHKLRLEARDGAFVEITPHLETTTQKYASTIWLVTKFVSLSIASSGLLIFAARQISG